MGTVRPASLAEQTEDDLDAVLALNLRCALRCTRALLPGIPRRASAASCRSRRAQLWESRCTAYAASKAGIIGMTRVWALELGPLGITANAVAPRPIVTELFERANPPGSSRTAELVSSIPAGRLGRPEDVAHATAFFLHEQSGFFTGQSLYDCGGKTVGSDGL